MAGTPHPALRTVVTRSGGVTTVALSGELDLATAELLRADLRPVLSAEPCPRTVVVDLSSLAFLDACGIAVLLEAQRALSRRGARLTLRSPSRLVRRVVKVLELEDALPIER